MKTFSTHLILLSLLVYVSLGVFIFNQTQFDSLTHSVLQNIYLLVFVTITFVSAFEFITSKYLLPPLYWMTFIPITLIRLLSIPLIIEVIPIYHIPFVGMIMLVFVGSVLEMEYLRHGNSQTGFSRLLLISSISIYLIALALWMSQLSSFSFAPISILGILTAPIILYGNILHKNTFTPARPHQIILGVLYSIVMLLFFTTSYLVMLPAQ